MGEPAPVCVVRATESLWRNAIIDVFQASGWSTVVGSGTVPSDGPPLAWVMAMALADDAKMDWDQVASLARDCETAAQAMKADGSIIILISALHAFADGSQRSAIHAAAAMLTKTLAIRLAPRALRVNAVATIVPEDTGIDRIPLRRPALPIEVANAVFFLATEDASYVTGEVLHVDAGWGAYQLF